MRRPVVLPPLGDAPVRLNLWLARPGDHVFAGDRLVEVLLDAATFDVPAPVTGRLFEIHAWPGQDLDPGQILGYVEEAPEEQ